jgi:hypothetical protein
MSKRGRIVLFIIVAVVLAAAILSVIAGDSPLRLFSIMIITVVGALSALVQFTGTDTLWKLFKELLPKSRIVTPKELLKHLIDQHLLVRCEAVGRRPIYQLDDDYWTNLILDFPSIVHESDTLDLCAKCVHRILSPKLGHVLIVDPLELGESQPDIHQALEKIVNRMSGQFVRTKEIYSIKDTTLLIGVFSSRTRDFLLREGKHITNAVFLIGPDSAYLSEIFKDFTCKFISIISSDTLKELDMETRRSILWYPN